MPLHSAIKVTIPTSIAFYFNILSTCSVEYNSVTYQMTCIVSGNTVYIQDGLSIVIPKGSTLIIRIGLITNLLI